MATMPWEETYQKETTDTSTALPWEQTYAKPKESEGAKQLPQSDDSSDFARALFTNQLPQLKETYGAAKVLTGKALGDKEMMQSGMETMKAGQKQQVSKESDELTKALEMGIGTVLTDWLPYQVGAGVGSLLESLAMAGIGAGVGAVTGAGVGSVPGAAAGFLSKQLVKKGVKEAAEAIIQKELKEQLANKVAKKEAKQLAEEAGQKYIEAETKNLLTDLAGESAKAAAKKGAVAYGTTAGMAGQATLHGMGETTSRAIQEEEARAKAEGREFNLDNIEGGRLGAAALIHGVADFVTEKITLGAVKGLPKPSSGSFAKDIVKHMALTGGKEVIPEEIQTAAERFGAKLSLADAEALKDYVNTAGAALVMGAIPGGVGGARTYLAGKAAKDEIKDAVDKEVDTSSKVEDKPAEEVAKETLETAPADVAEQAVASTLNTIPNAELDPKIDEVTAKIKEVEDVIEGGENLSRKDYAAYYRQLDGYQAQLEDLLSQKAAAQQEAVASGEPTPGQKLKNLAAGIKAEETPAAPVTELDADIARIEAGIASGEEYKHPKALAAAEAKLARLKAQRETQDVAGADVGTSGAGATVPTGPSVADTATTTGAETTGLEGAPAIQAPAAGGTTEQLGTLETPQGGAQTMTLFRGVRKGYEGDSTVGGALFMTPNRDTAEMYASEDGSVNEATIEFNNVLAAPNWVEAKKQVGLKSNNTMEDLVNAAREQGYDGITFNTTNGQEVIYIPSPTKTDEKEVAPTNKKAKVVAKKSELAYFNQPTYYGEKAPTDIEEGMNYAANEHGFDNFDAVDYDKGVKPALEAIVKEKNAEQAEKRAYLEANKDQYSDEEYRKRKAEIKDYNISNPLEFMTLDELTDLYASHISEKPNWKNKGGKKRTDNMVAREQFLATLSPEQRAQVQDDAYSAFMAEVKQDATSRLTTAADKRKAREKRNAEARKKKAIQGVEKQLKEEIKEASTEKPKKLSEYKSDQKRLTAEEVAELHRKIDERIESTIGNAPRLNEAVQSAIQSGASLREILDVIANRRLNDSTTAIYADNLLALLKAIGDIDVTFSIGAIRKAGADGSFNPAKNHITVKGKDGIYTGERKLAQTVLHEIMHFLTDHVVDNEAAYLKTLPLPRQAEVKAALNRLKQSHKLAQSQFGTKYNIGTLKEFIAEVFTNRNFQKDLATVEAKVEYVPKSSLFTRVVEAIARALSLTKDTGLTLRQALSDISEIVSLPTEEMRGKATSYAKTVSEEETANAILDAGEIDIRNIRDPQNNSYARHLSHIPKNYITEAIKLFFTRAGWRRIVHNVQNERYEVKRLETMMDRAGKTIYTGPDTNAVYTMFTRATGIGRNLFNDYVAPLQDRLQKQIRAYAKAEGIDVSGALHNLHRILEAVHEPERRLVKYILTVPLKPKAETIRKNIVDKLNSTTAKLDKKDLMKMRAQLDALVLDFDANGRVIPNLRNIDEIAAKDPTTGRDDTLIESDKYIVAGESATSSDIASRLSKYEAMEHKQLVDDIAETMAKLHRVTTILNKKAHFWSTPVSNRVEFYGWQNYMPLKGVPHSEVDEYLNFDSERLGRDLQQSQAPMVGREKSTSENPLLQTLSDAVSASLRAGRKDLTLAIKNAVEQGYIAGDTKLKISFEERQNPDILKKLPRENTIFHYGKDGSITVVQIHDKAMREAIRRTYRQNSLPVEVGNYITSLMGQMHTRYNYKFAPLNFVRDALTNAWTMGAQLGPMKSVKLISLISAQMVNGSMISKATRIAKAYATNDGEAINKFRKSNDPYVKNIMEFLQEGGMVEYIQGISLKSNFQKLHKDINRGSATRAKEVVDAIADIWTDTFEIASRAAAYSVAKSTFINDQKMDEKSARVKAAAFTKNLANFEEVGKHGKRWGAAFMFFRPAATGAVRAVEALLPAVTPVSKALSDLPPSLRNNKEAVAEFKKNYAKQQKNARYMTAALMGLGAATYLMAEGMSDDDDIGRNRVASDDVGLWARNARFFIPGMEKPVQIPWGFGMGAWASLGAQMMAIYRGNGNFGDLLNGVLQVTMDSFLPIPVSRMSINTAEDLPSNIVDTLTPSLLRPMLEFVMNKNGLGNQIYNDTNKRMGDAYLGSDNTPQIYKDIAVLMVEATNGGINVSPNTLYFYTNSYIDGPARFVDATADMFYALNDQKSFDSNMLRQAPIIGSFVGSAPNVDARLYAKAEQKILRMDADMKMFQSKPEQYLKYINNNPMAPNLVAVYNNTKPTLDALRHEANVIRGLGLSPKETKAILDANKMSQNLIKYSVVETFKGFDLKP